MTSILEKLVGIVAPHYCLECSLENNVLCVNCVARFAGLCDSDCGFCGKPTADYAVCGTCRRRYPLDAVWAATYYEGTIARAIKLFKFERVRAAHAPLARILYETLPCLPEGTIITYVPTAPARIRMRGYDHAALIAKELGCLTGLACAPLLGRKKMARQVGADRKTRFMQMEGAFEVTEPARCNGVDILLIDDVITTGATLGAAAAALAAADARSVRAAVVARQVTLR